MSEDIQGSREGSWQASEQLCGCKKFSGGKVKLLRSEKLKWPFSRPSINTLRADLREAKGTLMLMLQMTTLALSKKMADFDASASSEQGDMYAIIVAFQREHEERKSHEAVAAKKRLRNGKPVRSSIDSLSTKVEQDSDSIFSGQTARGSSPTLSGASTPKAARPAPIAIPMINTMTTRKMVQSQPGGIEQKDRPDDCEDKQADASEPEPQRALLAHSSTGSSSTDLLISRSSTGSSHMNSPPSTINSSSYRLSTPAGSIFQMKLARNFECSCSSP